MKLLLVFAFFTINANIAYSQTAICEDSIRRIMLTFIKDLSKSNYQRVEEIAFDYPDSTIFLHDDNIAVKVYAKWTTKEYFQNKYWVVGYVIKNPNTGRCYWFTETSSRNINQPGKHRISNLDSEEDIVQAMGIGKPMRKKSASNTSSN